MQFFSQRFKAFSDTLALIAERKARRRAKREARTAGHIKAALRRRSGRRALAHFAERVTSGWFSIKRQPRHLARLYPHLRHVREYPRLSARELKKIEHYLKGAYPQLNRKERRHLARGYRWMFLSHA